MAQPAGAGRRCPERRRSAPLPGRLPRHPTLARAGRPARAASGTSSEPIRGPRPLGSAGRSGRPAGRAERLSRSFPRPAPSEGRMAPCQGPLPYWRSGCTARHRPARIREGGRHRSAISAAWVATRRHLGRRWRSGSGAGRPSGSSPPPARPRASSRSARSATVMLYPAQRWETIIRSRVRRDSPVGFSWYSSRRSAPETQRLGYFPRWLVPLYPVLES